MLAEDKVLKYWLKRSHDQGERATGHTDTDLHAQRNASERVKQFIWQHCPTELKTLDYGCGVGRYAELFDKYIGFDITDQFLRLAKASNPTKLFYLSDTPFFKVGFEHDFEMFLSVTVLQHNHHTVVKKIFENVKQTIGHPLLLCLYENTTANSEHCVGRSPAQYLELLKSVFDIECSDEYKHDKHHSLLVAQTK